MLLLILLLSPRFLTFACGSPEVRQLASSRLEMWMMNPKISRSAQELLCGVTLNCVTHSAIDIEVRPPLLLLLSSPGDGAANQAEAEVQT